MHPQTFLLFTLALLSWAPRSAAQEALSPFEVARSSLAKIERVDGAAVGRGAQPGAFYRATQELAQTGTKRELLALLDHERAVVRAAGMVCLVKAHPEDALEALEARTSSKAELSYMPQGCSVSQITEGQLATKLLLNADLLERAAPRRPLLAVPLSASEPTARRWHWARAALLDEATALTVNGAHVGFAGTAGRFYLLVKELEATGKRAGFEALLAHEHEVVRAAGMVCVAKRFPQAAAKALAARTTSPVELNFQPSGCGVEVITEGKLANILLADPNVLD